MPTYVRGDLWSEVEKADLLLVTTNATVNARGCLVMGRGAAKEAVERYPGLSKRFGDILIARNRVGKLYGLIGETVYQGRPRLGAFQVKYYWRDAARLEVIAYSAGRLASTAALYRRIAMNMPGTGNGRLQREDVLPLLEPLPAHVIIYEYEETV